jgi:hypothetical protein
MDFGCDEIKCINLMERTDKRASFTKMMKNYEVSFTFFDAIKDKLGAKGCFLSHAKIISDAYKKGVKRLMIFEDDACFVKKIGSADINEIRSFLDNNDDWEIFNIGGIPEIFKNKLHKQKNYDTIYRGQFLNAGAYILNQKGIEHYKNLEWSENNIIDSNVFLKNKKYYGRLPRVYMQRLIPNDIEYGVSTKKISLFVRLRAIWARISVFYGLHINIELLKIFVLILVLTIIFVKLPIFR